MSAEPANTKIVEMKSASGAPPEAAATAKPKEAEAPRRSRRRFLVMGAVPAILLVVGAWLWLTSGGTASTDNAYVQQDRVTITSDVSGRIVEAAVRENDRVTTGDLLFRIDPQPYRIALDGAEAALASARLQVQQLRAAYEQAVAEQQTAADDVVFEQKKFDRQQGLLKKGVSSQANFDTAENDLHVAQQALSQAKQHTQAALSALGGDPSIKTDDHPMVLAALARREQAALDLANTEVKAPSDGVVAQSERLQVGQYVTAATPVLAVVETGNSWVEANFKETDLTNMAVGDKATIDLDAYPAKSFAGEVASIGAGTGAEFSVLPAQNATGNWVKVVQRVPVRIRFTDPVGQVPLRMGLSASVAVDLQSGSRRRRRGRVIQGRSGHEESRVMSAGTLSAPAIETRHRGLITVAIMAAMIMQILDMTIANVALPHMQTSLGASQDTITWVLTSYIVAAAIATPITGWLADNFGRKRLFLVCVVGFVASSALCGTAFSLGEMVVFRLMQGAFGAALAPLSQAVLMDINPRERQGQAMALWGAGIMIAPIVGPTIGAYLTDHFNWRWVFYINVPVGILAFLGILVFMPETVKRIRRFDFFGFAMLSIAVGAMQFMLDRGQQLDWFASPEVLIETGLSIAALWVFIVHTATAREPFLEPVLFRDRNFAASLAFIFVIGIILLATMALLPPMLQNLFGYPVVTVGLVLAPRGIGTMISMLVVGRLVRIVDPRLLVFAGLMLAATSLWMMMGFSLDMDEWPLITSGVIQGFGLGLVFIPLSTVAFATLDPRYRTEATSLFNLMRNLGSSIGISIVATALAANAQIGHASLVRWLNPFNPNLTAAGIDPQSFATPAGVQMAAILNGEVTRQALMIAYVDDFKLMLIITLCAAPLLLLLRHKPMARAPGPPAAAMAE